MRLLPVSEINIDHSKAKEVEEIMKSTFRLITFSRYHFADDLLNAYISSTTNLKELLSLKNAQMEAQTDEEAEEYVVNLRETLLFVANEIENHKDFTKEIQLFQLFQPKCHYLPITLFYYYLVIFHQYYYLPLSQLTVIQN